ncbi:MAG: hypothetical protein HY329_05805 [Chloroflexi bacterium]|nr:hypothetical protein [Chloroflexota bacterium]
MPNVLATCVDVDTQTLMATARVAERRGCNQNLAFLQGNVILIAEGQEPTSLPPQQMIYALGFCDYLTDDQVIDLVDWSYRRLVDGGTLVLTNLDASNPDRELMEHILEWKVNHRTADELRDLVQRTELRRQPLEIRPDASGVNLFVIGTKRV